MGLFDSGYSDVMAGTPRLSGRGAVPARSFGQLLSLLGEPLPGSDEMQTSAMYRAGLLDAMAGGPTQGEFREGMRNKMANTALGLLGAIEPLYHGSPHKFSKFDLSKIGTGEGAQAYGHGAYLAESPEVAKNYAKLTNVGRLEKYWNIEKPTGLSSEASDAFDRMVMDLGKTPKKFVDSWEKNKYITKDVAQELRNIGLDNIKPVSFQNLYEARLRWPDAAREAADPLGPQHFLDWDKPLSEQAVASVKPVPKDYNGQFGTGEYGGFAWYVGDTQVSRAHKTPELARKYAPLGSEVIRDLNAEVAMPTGHNELMRQASIPGIRYLDAGSRGAGAGTHNYVVFDDALIELLKRNGEAIGGLLGGK